MAAQEFDRPVLIGSCGSSGSTLLSVMLDAHPDLLSGPELALFSHPFFWRTHGASWREPLLKYLDEGYRATFRPEWTLANGFCPYSGLVLENTMAWYGLSSDRLKGLIGESADGRGLARAMYGPLLERQGKRRWVEKSPQNVYAFQAFLEAYPHGRVVYMVRDARDVVCSLMRKGWGGFKRTLAFWLVDTALCETFRDHPRAHRVRYEDLVRDPRDTVAKLLDFLGVSPEVDRVLNFHSVSARAAAADASSAGQPTWHHAPTQPIGDKAVGAWKDVLSQEQLACVHAATIVRPLAGQRAVVGESGGQLLERLGYEPVCPARVDAGALHRLILEEKLFLSGTDYPPLGPFGTISPESHEAYVECDPVRLPKADFSWDDKRLLAKFGQVREEFLALWAATRERQAEIHALREEQRRLRAVPIIHLLYRMRQLPYGEWPRALARKLRELFGGGTP